MKTKKLRTVFVVVGHIDYEGEYIDSLWYTQRKADARKAEIEDLARKRGYGGYDAVEVRRMRIGEVQGE